MRMFCKGISKSLGTTYHKNTPNQMFFPIWKTNDVFNVFVTPISRTPSYDIQKIGSWVPFFRYVYQNLLKRCIQKSANHLVRRSSQNSQRVKSSTLSAKNTGLEYVFGLIVLLVKHLQGNCVPCLFNVGLFYLISKDFDTFL